MQLYVKSYNIVVTLAYGSELLSMIITTDLTMALIYKLIILGVQIDGMIHMVGGNDSVDMFQD